MELWKATSMHFRQPMLVLIPALFTNRSMHSTWNTFAQLKLSLFTITMSKADLEVCLTLIKKPEDEVAQVMDK